MSVDLLTAEPVVDDKSALGESPVWEPETGVHWLDVDRWRLHTLYVDGRHEFIGLPRMVTSVSLAHNHSMLAVTVDGFALIYLDQHRFEPIAQIIEDPSISMNDATVDSRGRCWAGSAVRDGTKRGALYLLQGKDVKQVADEVGMSNGIGWSPDERRLYHVDTAAGTVRSWSYDDKRSCLETPTLLRWVSPDVGLLDGLAVDQDGRIWLAVWGTGEVWCLDQHTGSTLAVIEVPTPYVTSCAFGGTELSTLYITTADYDDAHGGGLLYAVDTPTRGLGASLFEERLCR
ncbi:SMP-30/gluconolactonase/LRE family protein [Prauserella flavalba]|uniref:SMP-30/gluconolactonase/LRE family protein n=1 Tax=Prauserella flavalba TaxID=1477506 RepID=UPI0036E37F40